MVNCLVTGGAGFIGSHLVGGLLARGDQVRIFDNFSTGKRSNLADYADRVEIIEGDLRGADQVASAVRGVDLVFHQAAFVSPPQSMEQPELCFQVNVEGTINLLEAARQAGVRRVVVASSAAVYGDSGALPLLESTPPCPLSPYAASKQINETLAALYTRAFDLPVVALRYFNVYGPRQSPDSDYAAVIPIFIRRLLDGGAPVVFGDGGQTRDFIFVADVVRANLLAAEADTAAGQVVNICTGLEISLLDLLATLAEFIPGAPDHLVDLPRRGDIYRSVGSTSLAQDVLGFQAQTSIAQGLKQTMEWMQA